MERWRNYTDRGTEVWSIGGMILTGETELWSVGGMILTGEIELWSVGGMILTEEQTCGAWVE